MDIIKNVDIENALIDTKRVYLCGNLQAPNNVNHVQTAAYEIGISDYKIYTCDTPHIHTYNMEYNYVLEGEMKILLIDKKQEFHLKKGDMFVIHPNEPYAGKSKAGTRTLFSKVPGGNDKEIIPVTVIYENWSKEWSASVEVEEK